MRYVYNSAKFTCYAASAVIVGYMLGTLMQAI